MALSMASPCSPPPPYAYGGALRTACLPANTMLAMPQKTSGSSSAFDIVRVRVRVRVRVWVRVRIGVGVKLMVRVSP